MIQKSNAHPTSQPNLVSLHSTLFLPLFKYYVPLKSCKDICPDLPEGSVHAFLPHLSTTLLDFSAPAVKMTTPALLQCKWRGVAPLSEWEKTLSDGDPRRRQASTSSTPRESCKMSTKACNAFVAIAPMSVPVHVQTGKERFALPTGCSILAEHHEWTQSDPLRMRVSHPPLCRQASWCTTVNSFINTSAL